jgi:hypothetical protein
VGKGSRQRMVALPSPEEVAAVPTARHRGHPWISSSSPPAEITIVSDDGDDHHHDDDNNNESARSEPAVQFEGGTLPSFSVGFITQNKAKKQKQHTTAHNNTHPARNRVHNSIVITPLHNLCHESNYEERTKKRRPFHERQAHIRNPRP